MTSDLIHPNFKLPNSAVPSIRPLNHASQPLTLNMNLALGTKAKLAISSGLGTLKQKLRMSSLASPGGMYSGVVQNQSAWKVSEQRVWVAVLVVGVALLHGNRMSVPLVLAHSRDWNASFKVSSCFPFAASAFRLQCYCRSLYCFYR